MSDSPQKYIYINFTVSEKEYVLSSLYLLRKNIIIVYFSTFLILSTTFYLLSFTQSRPLNLLVSIISTFLILILGFYRTIWLYRRNFKKDHLVQEKVNYKISFEGLEISRNRGSIFMSWNDYNSIKEYKGLFFLYTANSKAHIIPIRSFPNEDELQLFKSIANTSIPNKS